jgi:hypothetical protein
MQPHTNLTLTPWLQFAQDRGLRVVDSLNYNNPFQFNATKYMMIDHVHGFDKNLRCPVLDILNTKKITLWTEQIMQPAVREYYKNIDFKFDAELLYTSYFKDYVRVTDLVPRHQTKPFNGFATSWNRGDHVGRQFLTAGLHKWGMWDSRYCSKGFTFTKDRLDGNLTFYLGDDDQYYRKFIIDDTGLSNDFYNSVIIRTKASDMRFKNLLDGLDEITSTFLTIISETKPESYHHHMTEKVLFPIVTRNLWIACAHPNYHHYIETYLGFKKFDKIFDYSFDAIQNPVKRVVSLLTMLKKFTTLSNDDLVDLYRMEQDTISFNYDHYASGDYLTCLKQYDY